MSHLHKRRIFRNWDKGTKRWLEVIRSQLQNAFPDRVISQQETRHTDVDGEPLYEGDIVVGVFGRIGRQVARIEWDGWSFQYVLHLETDEPNFPMILSVGTYEVLDLTIIGNTIEGIKDETIRAELVQQAKEAKEMFDSGLCKMYEKL